MEKRKCSFDGCERAYYAKGYCNAHYKRYRKYGEPGPVEIREVKYGNSSVCSVDDCDERKHHAKGYCEAHYHQHYEATPRRKRMARDAHLRRRYEMTIEDFENLLDAQGHVCASCGSVEPGGHTGVFQVDHDGRCCPGNVGSCGRCVRALLCAPCNQRREDKLPHLVEYLKQYPDGWWLDDK